MPGHLYLVRDSTTQDPSGRREPVLREVITRNGPMSQEVVRYFGQHMARLYADTSSRNGQDLADTPPTSEERDRASASADDEPLLLEGDEYNQVSGLCLHRPIPALKFRGSSFNQERVSRKTACLYRPLLLF
jgi:hypothetical protein